LIIFLFFTKFFVTGQIIPSNCNGPDSIKAKYADDSDRLALFKIYRQNLTYKDSVIIPKIHSDTIMNAMMAVYNASVFPERDTVVSLLNIHTSPSPSLKFIYVAADSTLPWMQQLANYNYSNFQNTSSWQVVTFVSDSNYNLLPLSALFKANPGVYFSGPDWYIGDGNNILDSIYSDRVELIYSLGWGDCPAGCTGRRYWKFNVYFDCSIEFAGSYGAPLPFIGIQNLKTQPVKIYPSPFSNQLNVELHHNLSNTIILYDFLSLKVLQQQFADKTKINTESLDKGIYFYEILVDRKMITSGKIIKN
jgi:Secretion system C-terminal sorting domain